MASSSAAHSRVDPTTSVNMKITVPDGIPPTIPPVSHETCRDAPVRPCGEEGKSTTGRILTMKVTEKGQVTIPKELRDALGIGAGTEVEFERCDDTIVVRKSARAATRGSQLVERLRGRGDVTMTTDEIMALTRGA